MRPTVEYFWLPPGWVQQQQAAADAAGMEPAEGLAPCGDVDKLHVGNILRARESVMDAWAELEQGGFRLARVVGE